MYSLSLNKALSWPSFPWLLKKIGDLGDFKDSLDIGDRGESLLKYSGYIMMFLFDNLFSFES